MMVEEDLSISPAPEDEIDLDLSKLNKVIVADDQDINLEVLKQFFASLQVTNVQYCVNGQIAIDTCCEEIDLAIASAGGKSEV